VQVTWTMVATGLGTLLLAILGSAGMWSYLTARGERDARREEKEVDRLAGDLKDTRARHAECEKRLDELERRVETVEHHHSSMAARWIKDAGKRVLWLNDSALAQVFWQLGFSRDDVVGRTFAELGLDAGPVTEIDRLDRRALARPGEAASTMLTIRRDDAPPGVLHELPPMLIAKVAGPGRDGALIYEGFAFRANDPVEVQARGDLRQQEQKGASTLHQARDRQD
jgi:tetrahydromethanopterin S-methyltransferase subunit G